MTRDTVRFRLDGVVHEVCNPDPTMTVLRYLRESLRRTGTKEGCGEGDCGACTIVVADPEARPVFRALNACILFLPMIDGKSLYTVESVSPPDGPLHPVQQALVDSNASQCGFCTPGFVMSLYACYRNGLELDEAGARDALAGNLCRCTGYGPIIAAAQRMAHYPAPDQTAPLTIDSDGMLAIVYEASGTTRRFFAPRNLAELAELSAAYPNATYVAGATDVGLWVTKRLAILQTIISLGRVAELRQISETDNAIEIGAAVSYAEAYAALARMHPDIGELLRRLGSVQLRNAGTIGGNIANGSPIGDSLPPLIALGARAGLNKGGVRRTLPLEDFFLGYGKQDRAPGEFVETILVPKRVGRVFRAHKISKRFDQDISAVCAAIAFRREGETLRDVRLAFGGMAATPKRAANTEAVLEGSVWSETIIRDAMAALEMDFAPISDMRASAAYRLLVAKTFLWRLWLEGSGAPLVRVPQEEALHDGA